MSGPLLPPPRGDGAEQASARQQRLRHWRHELRTPMNAIVGYSEMILEDAQDARFGDAARGLRSILQASTSVLAAIDTIHECVDDSCNPWISAAQKIAEGQKQIAAFAEALARNAPLVDAFGQDVEEVVNANAKLGGMIAAFSAEAI